MITVTKVMLFCGVCKSFTTHKASFVNYFFTFPKYYATNGPYAKKRL